MIRQLKQLMCALIVLIPSISAGDEIKWLKWPADAGHDDSFMRYPSNFKVIPSLVKSGESELLNLRVQSPGGEVVFAYTAIRARGMPAKVKDRAIEIPLAKGEKVVERKPVEKKIESEYGAYILWDEAVTVEGPNHAYTRYFLRQLSTSNLPGASSGLWEFKVTGEDARKRFQEVYAQFKKTVSLGEF